MTIDGNKLMMSLNDWWYSSFGYDEETEDSKAIKTVVDKIEESLKDFIPESCEDAISRADAVKVASGYCHPANVAKELAKLPPVTPKQKAECSCDQIKWERDMAIAQLNELGYGLGEKPKVGHWIHLKHGKGKCSECHDVVLIAQMYGNANYCPNCGARMVEPQESEKTE